LAQRLIFDANNISSTDLSIRCERSETPDDLAQKWLKMMKERPLQGFQITKRKWWQDVEKLIGNADEEEKKEYFEAVSGDDCLQAMKKALKK
ncbi:unnamed protein product, partial [Adineta steineri]